ncbi:MAG TPA: uracil-DNA glycosylase family protein [Dehalococcoidia bacterium]|nr:uracil-DNA glycosylase family protein [Dehalococcoidia bacterium]
MLSAAPFPGNPNGPAPDERGGDAPAAARAQAAFEALVQAARACRACPAMEGRRRVLGPANGSPPACVLFLAEAPGRLGGELTGVPLSADQSGRRFERLLRLAGLARAEVFISNAALCNPQDARGRNRPPVRAELANCAGWLAETLRVVDPAVVVTLGATALAALDRLEPHGRALRGSVGCPARWDGRWLYPLYHPSPRAGLSRPYAEQDEDFRRLGAWLRRAGFARPGGAA